MPILLLKQRISQLESIMALTDEEAALKAYIERIRHNYATAHHSRDIEPQKIFDFGVGILYSFEGSPPDLDHLDTDQRAHREKVIKEVRIESFIDIIPLQAKHEINRILDFVKNKVDKSQTGMLSYDILMVNICSTIHQTLLKLQLIGVPIRELTRSMMKSALTLLVTKRLIEESNLDVQEHWSRLYPSFFEHNIIIIFNRVERDYRQEQARIAAQQEINDKNCFRKKLSPTVDETLNQNTIAERIIELVKAFVNCPSKKTLSQARDFMQKLRLELGQILRGQSLKANKQPKGIVAMVNLFPEERYCQELVPDRIYSILVNLKNIAAIQAPFGIAKPDSRSKATHIFYQSLRDMSESSLETRNQEIREPDVPQESEPANRHRRSVRGRTQGARLAWGHVGL